MTATGSSPSGAFSGTLPPSGPTVRAAALVELELRTAAAALVTLASLPGVTVVAEPAGRLPWAPAVGPVDSVHFRARTRSSTPR